MRQAFEAVSKAYETVKKSVQEKWEGFKQKFEGTKSEMSREVMEAKSPDDLIALGKKLQEQGEALKIEEQEVKQEGTQEEQNHETNKAEMINEAHGEALEMNQEFDANKAAEEEAKRKAEIAEQDRLAAEQEAAKLAEIRAKINGESIEPQTQENIESANIENVEQSEKINEAKNILMQLFDKAGWTSFSELMNKSENILDGLSDGEQEKLANEFFNDTIGKTISNNRGAYQVYGEFKGTAFAKKFAKLEDGRLKRAGYAGFVL